MKKRIITAMMAVAMMASMAVPAYAAGIAGNSNADISAVKPVNPPIEPQYATLISDKEVDERNGDQYTSTEFTATPGNGDDIRFWFNNKGTSTVRVRLQKKIDHWLGGSSWSDVAEQNVTPGNAWYNTYVGGGKSRITYRITLSADGYAYKGTLRVAQVP